MDTKDILRRAADVLRFADAIVITAGAGMSVDSGLPDFRGDDGFWKAYPAFRHLGLSFSDLANPRWFEENPRLAWGFYGHRLNLYRRTTPHAGYDVLRRFSSRARDGAFVFTSNVDGAFATAGFDPRGIVECHGSIHHVQCMGNCDLGIVSAENVNINVDEATMQVVGPLPRCPRCGSLLRPNILMFGDPGWDYSRAHVQDDAYRAWLDRLVARQSTVAVLEVGAGKTISTVRHQSQSIAASLRAALIRVNLRDSDGPPNTLSIPMGAKDALIELELLARG